MDIFFIVIAKIATFTMDIVGKLFKIQFRTTFPQ